MHMICYPADVREIEIEALSDYWLTCDVSSTGFYYTVKKVDAYYRSEGARSVVSLMRKGSFSTSHPAFVCEECQYKFPVNSRADYRDRMKSSNSFVCRECLKTKENRLLEGAHKTIQKYKNENLKETFDLESLSTEEAIALLSISAGQVEGESKFLCESPDEVLMTGIPDIDYRILSSFLVKKVITYIHQLPKEVECAYRVLHGDVERISYDKKYKNNKAYRHPGRVARGIYLNKPMLAGSVPDSRISTLIYQKIQSSTLSVKEISNIKNIIKEMQLGKIYQLAQEISKEYVLPIDNSNVLNALLEHLAGKYSPLCINFTFNIKARDAVVYIRKTSAPDYMAKNYFAKFVGDYVQLAEAKGWSLEKMWSLPPTLLTSPFEAIFSNIYLNDHFDWNRLSANEVVALWLENVQFSESAQNLLADESGSQD